MNQPLPIKLALVDDHVLFRKGLRGLIETIGDDYSILFEANSGKDLQQKLRTEDVPDLILLDIQMPGMDGIETVIWLGQHFPQIRILVVSMIHQEEIIVKMLRLGVKGYVCKDVEPNVLAEALRSIFNQGYYYTDFVSGKLIHSLQKDQDTPQKQDASDRIKKREKEFLQLACSEMTYNEIAATMFLSPKTIDGYRTSLFEKLNVKTRVGLALFAVRNGLVNFS
jgi:DNA-binding NarL/FixJ family response regulator